MPTQLVSEFTLTPERMLLIISDWKTHISLSMNWIVAQNTMC